MALSTSNLEHRTSNPSILVLGGEGMLGHKMFQILSRRYPGARCSIRGSLGDPFYRSLPLFAAENTIDNVNAMDLQALQATLASKKPDFIINCVGMIKQREEAKSAIHSIALNSLLPHLLAEWAAGWGGRLIHISSDCIFSGHKGNYSENDPADADDLYGRSKFLGEIAGSPRVLTLRTSIIGRELRHFASLLEWFMAQKGRKVSGFKRVIYSGVTTNYLAEVIGDIIHDYPDLCGLFQVTAPAISKHDLLVRLRTAFDLDIEIVPDESQVSDRSMVGERFRKATGYDEPSWDELISQLAKDPTPYSDWGLVHVPMERC